MSKKTVSKREFRDGVSKKSTRKPTAKVADGAKNKRQISGESKSIAVPKTQTVRAKKLVVRSPNQKIVERSRDLKEKRSDLENFEPVRLQKALAASGVGSRREMEDWITQGWVTVNGKTAQLGDKVSPDDQVLVKGSVIKLKWPDRLPRIILYYKQEGEIVTRDDPEGRTTVFDRLPQTRSSKWVAIPHFTSDNRPAAYSRTE